MKYMVLLALASIATAKPVLINDAYLVSAFGAGVGAYFDESDSYSVEKLKKQADSAPFRVKGLQIPTAVPESPEEAVYLVGAVYQYGESEEWHVAGVASAWALTTDGVMVTNYHLFEKAKGTLMGVCDRRGKSYPITEVLAASKKDDVVIFKTSATGIAAFPLGPALDAGAGVHVVSHPKRRFFTHTKGIVSRYYVRPNKDNPEPTIWMSITADFAVGSSGGPVLDEQNRLVGMVANTHPIYTGRKIGDDAKGSQQMVVKNCVPVSVIKKMTSDE
ncbi:MAG: S1 family peptidase [Verrucomicrobiales bacterium]|nr:serine protease [Verrucomicrobiota bacterium JB025]